MKKIYTFLFLIILLQIIYADILFELEDPSGDDYGAGNIIYPEHPMFEKGIFDIVSFKVSLEKDYYIFSLTFAKKIKPVEHHEFKYNYSLPDDFILPLVHIYIDEDHIEESGFVETIFGTNVNISPENAWERAVVFSSLSERYRGALKKKQPEFEKRTIIPDKIYISKNKKELSVKVPVSFLGEFSQDWGFTILVMSHDFSQTVFKNIYIREVKSTANQFNFGGGNGDLFKNYDPNIIDYIPPLFQKQKIILKDYDKENRKFTTVYAVYPLVSKVKEQSVIGEVKQISEDKVVINLGSNNGVTENSELLINSRITVIAKDVFPELTIAAFINSEDWKDIEIGMKVTVLKE